jgi:hypothetical protein
MRLRERKNTPRTKRAGSGLSGDASCTPGLNESYRLKLHKTLGPELLEKDPVALGGGDTHHRVQLGYRLSEQIPLALKPRGQEWLAGKGRERSGWYGAHLGPEGMVSEGRSPEGPRGPVAAFGSFGRL